MDLWPLFWVAIVIGITAYKCLDLWIDYLERKNDKDNKE